MAFFGNRRGVLGLVIIILVVGGLVFSNNVVGAFYHPSSSQPSRDPLNNIARFDDTHLTPYNQILTQVGGNQLQMHPNSTTPAIAISKSPFDPSTANSRELVFDTALIFSACCAASSVNYDWFLTKSSALPSSINSYNPTTDPNVMMVMSFVPNGGTAALNTFRVKLNITSTTDTISNEDLGCSAGGSSCLFQVSVAESATGPDDFSMILNYTGANGTPSLRNGSSCAPLGDETGAPSNPCSVTLDAGAGSFTLPGTVGQTIQQYPVLDIGTKYFIGFFAGKGGVNMSFSANQFNADAMTISNFLPVAAASAPPAPIQAGGFFAPLFNFLITGVVWMLAQIAAFFGWIFQVFKIAMDAVGNFLGIGPLGTNIINALSNFSVWVTSIFGTAFAQVVNATTFIVGALTAFANTVGTYWGLLTSFLSDLGSFLGGLWSVLSAFLQYGSIAGKYGLVLWWVMGMSMAYYRIDLFMLWTRLSYMFIWYPFKAADWLFENVIRKIILRFKEIVFQWV